MIITRDEAMEIAKEAAELDGYGVLCSTGYYVVYDNDENESIAVDICKQRDVWGSNEYFAVYASFDDDEGEWRSTDTLDINELADLIFETAYSRKEGD